MQMNNLIDLTRLMVAYVFIASKANDQLNTTVPANLAPVTMLLMWYKMFNYLTVFKPTRYLIKMIFEIINDIKAFLIILFVAILAYAQINYFIDDDSTFGDELRSSYVLAFGELGDWDTIGIL